MMTTSITALRVDNLCLLRAVHFLLLGGVAKKAFTDQAALQAQTMTKRS
jgi:hypothetical protein